MSSGISESWVEATTSYTSSSSSSPDTPPLPSHQREHDSSLTKTTSRPRAQDSICESRGFQDTRESEQQLRSSRAEYNQQSQHSAKQPRRNESSPKRPPVLHPNSSSDLIMPKLDADTLEASSTSRSRPTRTSRKAASRRRETSSDQRLPNKPSHTPSIQQRSAKSDPVELMFGHAGTMLSHLLDILGRSIRLLKTPLSIALAAFLLLQIILTTRNFIVSSIYSSVSPICAIPGVSLLNLPFCPAGGGSTKASGAKAEFEQLMTVQSKFEDVLRETAIGVTLPVEMKRSEASIRDLRQLVKYSHLGSRQELGLEFDGFIETARRASYDLQKFNSHIGRSVDQVLSTTRWTIRVLDDMSIHPPTTGALTRFLHPFRAHPREQTELALLNQYIAHAAAIESQLHALIEEALLLQMLLQNLDDRLEIIHSIVVRENVQITASRDDILDELWTLVGGNRRSLSKMDGQLDLLSQVNTYRMTAYAHVSATILKLQEISSGIEDLRERVSAPGNMGEGGGVVPLEVHLESIRLGVERLEGSRDTEKRNEVDNLGRKVDGRLGEERRVIDA